MDPVNFAHSLVISILIPIKLSWLQMNMFQIDNNIE